MDQGTRASSLRRLKRIEGQVRGVHRMVEEGEYCVDILTQVAAIRSALDQLAAQLATGHVKSCILGGEEKHDHAKCMSQDDLFAELQVTLSRLMR